jgi:hypothetical protein
MTTVMEQWQAALQPPDVIEFFRGMFDRAGVRVDGSESFTCTHAGDRITFSAGLREPLDFVVDITSVQAQAMLEAVKDGVLDEGERFRIMAALATPATRAALARPIIRNRLLRAALLKVGRAEMLMHVVLTPPPGEQDVAHTIAYADGQYLVLSGRHGNVPHVYRLTVADAMDYQRRMLAARKDNRLRTWLAFARWYGQMRKRVMAPA